MDEELAAVAEEISKLNSKIEYIENLLAKDFTEWTRKEKNLYGDEEKEARKALGEERKGLRESERELLKQKTILLQKGRGTEDAFGVKEIIKVEFSEEAMKLQLLAIKKQDQAMKLQLLAIENQKDLIETQRNLLDRIGPFLQNAIDKQWNLDASSKSTGRENDEFRARVFFYYGMSKSDDLPLPATVACHFLGVPIPTNLVTVAHIFPRRFRHNEWVPVSDIDHVQNTLVLFKPIERAFDTGRLCFVWTEARRGFRIHILDPALFSTTLVKLSERTFTDTQKTWKNVDLFPLNATFQDYHGQYLHLNASALPFKRCLAFHAHRARYEAIRRKWIKPDDLAELDDDNVWSPGAMEDKQLVELINSWHVLE